MGIRQIQKHHQCIASYLLYHEHQDRFWHHTDLDEVVVGHLYNLAEDIKVLVVWYLVEDKLVEVLDNLVEADKPVPGDILALVVVVFSGDKLVWLNDLDLDDLWKDTEVLLAVEYELKEDAQV